LARKRWVSLEISIAGKPDIAGQAVVIATVLEHNCWINSDSRLRRFCNGSQAEVETKDIEEVSVFFGNKIAPDFSPG